MLKIFQCFNKHCSCHLQGECVLGGVNDRKPYIDQVVGGEWNVKDVIGRQE
jgi:hypothetical protein